MTRVPYAEPEMTQPAVAQLELLFVRGGARARGTITIRQPIVVSDAEARCEIEVNAPGVLRMRHAISGGDTLQALLLAIRFLGTTLGDRQQKGLRLSNVEGGEFPLEAYFGPLLLATVARPATTIWVRSRRRSGKRATRRPPPAR